MFRITQNPSSGRDIQYLTKITNNGSIVLVVACAVQYVTTSAIEPLFAILVKYWISLRGDGSCVIRNMLEQFFKIF
jgi:hypothetical protein